MTQKDKKIDDYTVSLHHKMLRWKTAFHRQWTLRANICKLTTNKIVNISWKYYARVCC